MQELPPEVVGHGPRRDLLCVAIIYPVGVAILLGVLSLVLPKIEQILGVGGFIELVGGVLALTTVAQLSSGTEEVVLTTAGILPKTRFFGTPKLIVHRQINWDWLDPAPRGPISLGYVYFRWHEPGGYLKWGRLRVTPNQARAILAHPSCPRAETPGESLRRLGVQIPPSTSRQH